MRERQEQLRRRGREKRAVAGGRGHGGNEVCLLLHAVTCAAPRGTSTTQRRAPLSRPKPSPNTSDRVSSSQQRLLCLRIQSLCPREWLDISPVSDPGPVHVCGRSTPYRGSSPSSDCQANQTSPQPVGAPAADGHDHQTWRGPALSGLALSVCPRCLAAAIRGLMVLRTGIEMLTDFAAQVVLLAGLYGSHFAKRQGIR